MERLAKTSRSKINTAVKKHWLPYRDEFKLPVFVPPGSTSRGGEMATFAIIMATTLSYGTVQGYIWSIVEFHKQHIGVHGNPLDGVADWSRFMCALMVQTWVDTKVESHVMVPFPVLLHTLLAINQQSRREVALALMMLIMLFTMCRSQTPLPKTKSTFDATMHFRRKDFQTRASSHGEYLRVAMGIVKNSTKKERANSSLNEKKWKSVGNATGVLSILYWFNLYLNMSSWDSDDDPFFYDVDGTVLTYPFMLDLMRACMLRKFPWEVVRLYGFHGLRVLGFNMQRAAHGEEVAALIGEWRSNAWVAYSRDELSEVLRTAQAGVNYAAQHSLSGMPLDDQPVPPSALRDRPPPDILDVAAAPSVSPMLDTSPPLPPPVPLPSKASTDRITGLDPPDFQRITRKTPSKQYSVWVWRDITYYTIKAMRAAYQSWLSDQAEASRTEFFAQLASFGYTLLDCGASTSAFTRD